MNINVIRNLSSGKVVRFVSQSGSELAKMAKAGHFVSASSAFSDWLESQNFETEYRDREGLIWKEVDVRSRPRGDDENRGSTTTKWWQSQNLDTFVFFEGVWIKTRVKVVSTSLVREQ